MKRLLPLCLLGLMACDDANKASQTRPTPAATALYRVTFEAGWSASTHPGNYPAGAHFSPLIGASHHNMPTARLFQAGTLASQGIKDMAERGANAALRTEINSLISQGHAFRLLDGKAAVNSPGTLTDTIRLSREHPALSVVTMVAPSPDWFVALDSQVLLGESGWVESGRVPAVFYDAGTDSGPEYTSPDQPTTPPQPVRPAMVGTAPLGYFLVERIK